MHHFLEAGEEFDGRPQVVFCRGDIGINVRAEEVCRILVRDGHYYITQRHKGKERMLPFYLKDF